MYKDQGRIKKAEEIFLQILLKKRENLGSSSCTDKRSVTREFLYSDQGKMKEAEETYLRALAGFEHPRGYDHESTLSTAQDLGNIYIIRTRWTKLKQSTCGHDPGIAALQKMEKHGVRST